MLLKLIADLREPDKRFRAATEMAEWFGCSFLIIFVADPEIGILLPAQGFPQALPDGRAWQDFTRLSLTNKYHKGALPFPEKNTFLDATGIASSDDSFAILLGGNPKIEELKPLQDILPILVALFTQEQAYLVAETRASLADKSAATAEKLARTIDKMRMHLKDALNAQDKDRQDIKELMTKKDEFMNIASHELKTPITSMKAYLQIITRMLSSSGNPLVADFMYKANVQIDKLTSLIDDLMDVAKIQAGQMIYNFVDLDISEIILEVVSQIQSASSAHRIIIDSNLSVIVHGERNRLEQVLHNFLSNAIKYSPNTNKVIVRADLIDNDIKISVQDFGIGISPDLQPLVFDRFFRVHESSKHFSGLGLGLYISSEIIKRHKGLIGVKSNGRGSEFFFQLPVVNHKALHQGV